MKLLKLNFVCGYLTAQMQLSLITKYMCILSPVLASYIGRCLEASEFKLLCTTHYTMSVLYWHVQGKLQNCTPWAFCNHIDIHTCTCRKKKKIIQNCIANKKISAGATNKLLILYIIYKVIVIYVSFIIYLLARSKKKSCINYN